MKLRLVFASSASMFVLAACSGASSTELFSPPDSSEFGTEPTTDDGTGTSTSSGGSSGLASSSGGSSSGSTSSSSSSGSSGSTSGGTKDAGTPPPPPPPAPTGTIACGTGAGGAKVSCAAKTEVCCGSWNGSGKVSYACEPAGLVACVAGTSIGCDDRTDCPGGQVCCGKLEDNSGYTSVSCSTTCNSLPGLRAVRFCDPKAAVDECAAIGKYCGPSQSLPGYNVCRD